MHVDAIAVVENRQLIHVDVAVDMQIMDFRQTKKEWARGDGWERVGERKREGGREGEKEDVGTYAVAEHC